MKCIKSCSLVNIYDNDDVKYLFLTCRVHKAFYRNKFKNSIPLNKLISPYFKTWRPYDSKLGKAYATSEPSSR